MKEMMKLLKILICLLFSNVFMININIKKKKKTPLFTYFIKIKLFFTVLGIEQIKKLYYSIQNY